LLCPKLAQKSYIDLEPLNTITNKQASHFSRKSRAIKYNYNQLMTLSSIPTWSRATVPLFSLSYGSSPHRYHLLIRQSLIII